LGKLALNESNGFCWGGRGRTFSVERRKQRYPQQYWQVESQTPDSLVCMAVRVSGICPKAFFFGHSAQQRGKAPKLK